MISNQGQSEKQELCLNIIIQVIGHSLLTWQAQAMGNMLICWWMCSRKHDMTLDVQ